MLLRVGPEAVRTSMERDRMPLLDSSSTMAQSSQCFLINK